MHDQLCVHTRMYVMLCYVAGKRLDMRRRTVECPSPDLSEEWFVDGPGGRGPAVEDKQAGASSYRHRIYPPGILDCLKYYS